MTMEEGLKRFSIADFEGESGHKPRKDQRFLQPPDIRSQGAKSLSEPLEGAWPSSTSRAGGDYLPAAVGFVTAATGH